MFDPITTALIRSAPPLDGLDLDGLPKRLTEAFADIVSARIRMRGEAGDAESRDRLAKTLSDLRRLAAAHEAYAALLPDRDNRAAAAFVAASAHQAISLSTVEERISSVGLTVVSPDVCATLLFLIAEAHADAAEAAKGIQPSDLAGPIERGLLLAIRNVAQGRLGDVVRPDIPELLVNAEDLSGTALEALLLLLLQGVQRLAAQLRARIDRSPEDGGAEPARAIFARVKSLCVDTIQVSEDATEQAYSLYPGPLHLANLLLAVERDLIGTAITRIVTPSGVDEAGWWQILRRMARRRPYLWRNHRQAISAGYLEPGVSSAISFPTGAGKSTLAELKIATALLRGQKVVFLAPTHALVGQTTKALKKTFQTLDFDIIGDVDDEISIQDFYVLPEVTVTTPERCLMLISMQPEAFSDLGLVVFDECHLLHPRDEDRSRRGLDAMLALLNLNQIAPQADLLLLSAMMKNTADIAGWVKHLTGRDCLELDLSWKPTRQVRGCVVYPADQIAEVRGRLAAARRKYREHSKPPVAIQRSLVASPFGLFGLLQTWSTTDREDYALLRLLSNNQELSVGRSKGGDWYLTPNGNKVSSAIAASSVEARMKTLVFVQTTVFCESCVNGFADRINDTEVSLNDEESAWRALAEEEMGAPEHCYLKVDNDGKVRTGAASHHAMLLREERELHESLFRRPDGIGVIFATSTLAQGMNLPSEVVIISGDSRFDPDADRMKKLEAHELLNAAGRAGRAGEGAQGFVLLVPSKVIDFDNSNSKISGHWMDLQAIFEQADQCLVIDDPVESVLDQIHNGITQHGAAAYLLSKLPLGVDGAAEDPAETLLRKSFAAYRANIRGDDAWVSSRIDSAIAARRAVDLPDGEKWLEQVAGSTGLAVDLLKLISSLLKEGILNGSAEEAMQALLSWIDKRPLALMDLIRPESLEGLFGEAYKKLPSDKERAEQALAAIRKLLPPWMAGKPLNVLEAEFLGKADGLKKCEHARHFVSRIVPDLAFMVGLPARILLAQRKAESSEEPIPTVLATLSSIVREGCDSPEALATRLNHGRSISRVVARSIFDDLKAYIPPGDSVEGFETTRERVREADLLSKLPDL